MSHLSYYIPIFIGNKYIIKEAILVKMVFLPSEKDL